MVPKTPWQIPDNVFHFMLWLAFARYTIGSPSIMLSRILEIKTTETSEADMN